MVLAVVLVLVMQGCHIILYGKIGHSLQHLLRVGLCCRVFSKLRVSGLQKCMVRVIR